MMDKKQAYVGGTILVLCFFFVVCSLGSCCAPHVFYYAPFGGYWGGYGGGGDLALGMATGMLMGEAMDGPDIVEVNNYGDGGGDGGGS